MRIDEVHAANVAVEVADPFVAVIALIQWNQIVRNALQRPGNLLWFFRAPRDNFVCLP